MAWHQNCESVPWCKVIEKENLQKITRGVSPAQRLKGDFFWGNPAISDGVMGKVMPLARNLLRILAKSSSY
jgi:hypothetical protein